MAESARRGPRGGLKAVVVRLVFWPPVCNLLVVCASTLGRFADRLPPNGLSRRLVALLDRIRDRLEYWNLAAAIEPHEILDVARAAQPWSALDRTCPELLLFHSLPWTGGNWEYSRELIENLARLADEPGRFRLTVLLHPDQIGVDELRNRTPNVKYLFGRMVRIRRNLLRQAPHVLRHPRSRSNAPWYCTFEPACLEHALRADFWVALSDRFAFPFARLRPYAVVVHDVIQLHVPETFGAAFGVWRHRGMRASVAQADAVLVSSQATSLDVGEEYGVAADRRFVIPVACEPWRRFVHVQSKMPSALNEFRGRRFILCVANASPHKGHDALFRGYALLRRRLGAETPPLICCGGDTNAFSKGHHGADHVHWRRIRKLIGDLRLREGQDVFLLGYVDDESLRWLYENAALVVNAARFDNGTYCLVEASYFHCPVVSSRYAAVEELAARFKIHCRWFPIDDASTMSDQFALALKCEELPVLGVDPAISAISQEFSTFRYAERFAETTLLLSKTLDDV